MFVRLICNNSFWLQATDRDLPPNNEITYSIISGDTQANFTINSTTGHMTLAGPINYEAMAPELAGKFTLVVMAKDHGIPPLSSTVTVIVYVQVRRSAILPVRNVCVTHGYVHLKFINFIYILPA